MNKFKLTFSGLLLFLGCVSASIFQCKMKDSVQELNCQDNPRIRGLENDLERYKNDSSSIMSNLMDATAIRTKKESDVDKNLNKVLVRLSALNTELRRLSSSLGRMACDFRTARWGCYFVRLHGQKDVQYDDAVKLCRKENAQLATIPEDKVLESVLGGIGRTYLSRWRSNISVWIDLKIDTKTGKFTDEENSPESPWTSGEPNTSGDGRSRVYINASLSETYDVLRYTDPSAKLDGYLCAVRD